jgi:hypothetical protein
MLYSKYEDRLPRAAAKLEKRDDDCSGVLSEKRES